MQPEPSPEMTDEPLPTKRKLPVKRIIFWAGAGLTLLGYGLLSVPPETESPVAVTRAFLGMAAVIVGAMLWIGTFFYQRAKP